MLNNTQSKTVDSIYKECNRLLAAGNDVSVGSISDQIDDLTSFAKNLIKTQGTWSFGIGPVSVSTVEQILSDLKYDVMNWRDIVGLFLPDAVSLVTNDSRVVISLWRRVAEERPAMVILGQDNGVYSLLELESAQVVEVSNIQVAARVIAAGVEYL